MFQSVYGQSDAPLYKLDVATAPIAVYSSLKDWLADSEVIWGRICKWFHDYFLVVIFSKLFYIFHLFVASTILLLL